MRFILVVFWLVASTTNSLAVDVRSFGAKGDAITDDTLAIRAALFIDGKTKGKRADLNGHSFFGGCIRTYNSHAIMRQTYRFME